MTIRLLESIAVIADAAGRPEDRAALRRHAEMIVRGAREAVPEVWDREEVEERYRAAIGALRDAEAARPADPADPAAIARA